MSIARKSGMQPLVTVLIHGAGLKNGFTGGARVPPLARNRVAPQAVAVPILRASNGAAEPKRVQGPKCCRGHIQPGRAILRTMSFQRASRGTKAQALPITP